jgi:hypothetical protein
LFYGDASQFMAQCVGTLTCMVFVFVSFYAFFKVVDALMGNRVAADVELEGLDIPEMGALAYPDFVLGPGTPLGSHMASVSVPKGAASALKPARGDV